MESRAKLSGSVVSVGEGGSLIVLVMRLQPAGIQP